MCGYFCIGFIDFTLKIKKLLEHTNLLYPNDYENNFKNNIKIFSISKKMKTLYCVICGKYRKFVKPKISYFLEKTLVLSIVCNICEVEDENIFKEEESIWISKIIGLINNIEEY